MNWSANSTSIDSFYLYYGNDGGGWSCLDFHNDSCTTPILVAELPLNAVRLDPVTILPHMLQTSGAAATAGGSSLFSIGQSLSVFWTGPTWIDPYDVFYTVNGAENPTPLCAAVPKASKQCAVAAGK